MFQPAHGPPQAPAPACAHMTGIDPLKVLADMCSLSQLTCKELARELDAAAPGRYDVGRLEKWNKLDLTCIRCLHITRTALHFAGSASDALDTLGPALSSHEDPASAREEWRSTHFPHAKIGQDMKNPFVVLPLDTDAGWRDFLPAAAAAIHLKSAQR